MSSAGYFFGAERHFRAYITLLLPHLHPSCSTEMNILLTRPAALISPARFL